MFEFIIQAIDFLGKDQLTEVIVAIIAVFSGTGYWTWKAKVNSPKDKPSDNVDAEFKALLLKQVQDLIKQVSTLQDTKSELLEQIYSLRSDLHQANTQIMMLQATIKEMLNK